MCAGYQRVGGIVVRDYVWKSSLAKHIQDHIALQKASGLKFWQQEQDLQKFDHYYFYSGYQGTKIYREAVEGFIYVKGESRNSWRRKEVLLRNFGMYMNDLGLEPYIPVVKTPESRTPYIPHIYTKAELYRFFKAIDEYPNPCFSSRNLVDAVLFRFLYSTGVRVSEALNLTIADYDRSTGTAMIRHGKNNRDRLIPLHPSLAKRVNAFLDEFHKSHNMETHLFPSTRMLRMGKNTVYDHFRDYLLLEDIPHTGRGPRIHDFRHGFAVENLRRWSAEGKDLLNLIPYLSSYMGHSDYKATQYYLRLTAEIYPEMVEMLAAECMDIVPQGGEYRENS